VIPPGESTITVPPLTAFMVAMIRINGDMGRALRYRTGRAGYIVLAFLVCLWLRLVMDMLPGLADFLLNP
jgi:hypothetical protein